MASYQPVTAVLRGLGVLAATSRLDGRATLAEIHRLTGLDKSTILRMLETLEHAGFIVRNDERRSYQVTGKTLQLSAGYDRHQAVGTIVAPALTAFRTAVGWPSDVALFDHDSMLVVETSREPGPMFLNRRPGYRAPVLGTSLGLAYIAHCGERERDAVLTAAAADPAPWNDLARDRDTAERMFETIRRQGYATMSPGYGRQEYDGLIGSLGVPIMRDGRIYAAMNTLFLLNALTVERAVASLLAPLQATATQLAAELARHDAE
ncbi:regulatory protein, IclR [alpha proteobacterium BAL199]|jgi:IclR family transcriptional regulator, mhp operon transcriptional activator|nr:regulatory protein, IclR [alpha proteobacterium BAL199]